MWIRGNHGDLTTRISLVACCKSRRSFDTWVETANRIPLKRPNAWNWDDMDVIAPSLRHLSPSNRCMWEENVICTQKIITLNLCMVGFPKILILYPFYIVWLPQGFLSILQPGLEGGHCWGVPLPVGKHLLQHALHTAHFHGQTPPLSHHLPHEPTHSRLTIVHWKSDT